MNRYRIAYFKNEFTSVKHGRKNKINYSLFITLLILLFSSCRKETENADFFLEYPLDFTIQTGANPILTHVFTWSVPSSWNNFLSQNNLSNSDISSIRPVSIYVTTVFNVPINYDFVEEAKVRIYNPNDASSKQTIGEIYFEPTNREIDLFLLPGLSDCNKFVMLPQFKIDLNLRFREIIRTNTNHRIFIKFGIFKK
jgi:hypothetical protein